MNFKKKVSGSWTDVPHYVSGTGTDTITTLPATIYPLGQTATVGLKGNEQHTGTPTPTTPIMPQGTGDKTANLLDFYALQNAPSGMIGTTACNHVLELVLEANTAYTCISNGSGSTSGSAEDNRSIYFDNSDATNVVYSEHSVTVTTGTDGKVKIGFFSSRANAQQYINGTAQVWLVKGSAPLSYEPYGYKIPISSANTTTPVYLGEVETTRRIKKLVLTGEEGITSGHLDVNLFNVPLSDYLKKSAVTTLSTHYIAQANVNGWAEVNDKSVTCYKNTGSPTTLMYIRDSSYATVEAFKTYLQQQYAAGTPVTVWYVLATETTGIVNEPLMKIGDYADTVSGITIPTITGADSFDVLTTLKPSEVSLAYTGWHDATVKEWDGSEWQ